MGEGVDTSTVAGQDDPAVCSTEPADGSRMNRG